MPTNVNTRHECPSFNCSVQVPRSQLACRSHWFSLPKDLRGRIWDAYTLGEREAHSALIAEALEIFHSRRPRADAPAEA
jgi:hypothetical protein